MRHQLHRAVTTLFACALVTTSAYAAGYQNPIAPAATGQQQCYAPDRQNKTCAALAHFKPGPGDTINATASILVAPGPVIMTTSASVVARPGKLCGTLQQQHIERANFTQGGVPLDEVQSRFLRTMVVALGQGYVGREICATYVPSGNGLEMVPTVDGAPMPIDPQEVIWVSSDKHYSVGP